VKSAKRLPATILIVDDNESLLTLLSAFLTKAGYRCITKTNPKAAITVCKHEGVIDIVVTDFNMPNMNGLKLRTALRKLRPGLEVLFITGNPETYEMLVSKGFVCFQKPFDFTDLTSTIRLTLLNMRKERAK
jgi:DNA-binding NtrC family response regulator